MALWIARDEDGYGPALFTKKPRKDGRGSWELPDYDDWLELDDVRGVKLPLIKPGECVKVKFVADDA